MSTQSRDPFRAIPTWLPIAMAVGSVLCSAGATYATFGGRLDAAEHRLGAIELERADVARDYGQFKQDIRSDLAVVKTDVRWIRQVLSREPRP